jgi:hypothetical protein
MVPIMTPEDDAALEDGPRHRRPARGVGMTRTPTLSLHTGDTVEVEIEGVGTLRNPVAGAF